MIITFLARLNWRVQSDNIYLWILAVPNIITFFIIKHYYASQPPRLSWRVQTNNNFPVSVVNSGSPNCNYNSHTLLNTGWSPAECRLWLLMAAGGGGGGGFPLLTTTCCWMAWSWCNCWAWWRRVVSVSTCEGPTPLSRPSDCCCCVCWPIRACRKMKGMHSKYILCVYYIAILMGYSTYTSTMCFGHCVNSDKKWESYLNVVSHKLQLVNVCGSVCACATAYAHARERERERKREREWGGGGGGGEEGEREEAQPVELGPVGC